MTASLLFSVLIIVVGIYCALWAVNTNQYANPQALDTTRGPSASIWSSFRADDACQDPSLFKHMFDDFQNIGDTPTTASGAFVGSVASQYGWSTYFDQNGVFDTDPNLEGGVIALSTGANDATNLSMSSRAGWAGMIGPVASNVYPLRGKLWFECRVAIGSITTAKRDAFIGLVGPVLPVDNNITGSSTNTLATTPGLFGFHFRSTSNPTDVGLAYNVASGTVQYPTNLQTLVNTVTAAALAAYSAGTGFVKLGFIFDPTPQCNALPVSVATGTQVVGQLAKPMITIFVNGKACATFLDSSMIQAATFPSTFMAPAFALNSRSATSPGDFYIDWIRCAQVAMT